MRATLISLLALMLAACTEASFANLPPDAEFAVFVSALAAVGPEPEPRPVEGSPGEDPPPCESLLCHGLTVRVVTRACLGLGDAPRASVDGAPVTSSAREFSGAVPAEPENGYLEPGGWRSSGVGFVCDVPGLEYWPPGVPELADEHTIVLEGDGVAREVKLTDDGEILSCGFPVCVVPKAWQILEGAYVY